jgi:hypothetical protein
MALDRAPGSECLGLTRTSERVACYSFGAIACFRVKDGAIRRDSNDLRLGATYIVRLSFVACGAGRLGDINWKRRVKLAASAVRDVACAPSVTFDDISLENAPQ